MGKKLTSSLTLNFRTWLLGYSQAFVVNFRPIVARLVIRDKWASLRSVVSTRYGESKWSHHQKCILESH